MKRRNLTFLEIMAVIGSVENWAYNCPFKMELMKRFELRMVTSKKGKPSYKTGSEDGGKNAV